jgi:hypothetical protein
MTSNALHPSRLQLDLHLAGVDGASVTEHLAECPRCRARLERMASADSAFLEQYPTPASLQRPDRAAQGARSPAAPSGQPRRILRRWVPAVAAAAVAALVLGVLWVLPPKNAPLTLHPLDTERVKGGSIVEIAVKRDGQSASYEGQPLRSGDVLAFRVTTDRRYLMLLSVEKTGRVNVFLTDPTGQRSMAVTPGARRVLSRGIELDDYVGPERLVARLTDHPLSVAAVRSELRQWYRGLPVPKDRALEQPLPSFDGDTLTWLLTKVVP